MPCSADALSSKRSLGWSAFSCRYVTGWIWPLKVFSICGLGTNPRGDPCGSCRVAGGLLNGNKMDRTSLVRLIRQRETCLCVGLDPDPDLLPPGRGKMPERIERFNRQVIEATLPHAVAYKFNTAFYEVHGSEGWKVLERTIAALPSGYFTIADAKRADIANTSRKYAEAFFEGLGVDALTVSPYMGSDALEPFTGRKGKWAIILAVTSNSGAADLQLLRLEDSSERVYERVLRRMGGRGTEQDTMFVVGANRLEILQRARTIVPDHFLLIPGVGFQGGSLEDVCRISMNRDISILVNSSRGICFPEGEGPHQRRVEQAAGACHQIMRRHIRQFSGA